MFESYAEGRRVNHGPNNRYGLLPES
jgi:hypothetical protein